VFEPNHQTTINDDDDDDDDDDDRVPWSGEPFNTAIWFSVNCSEHLCKTTTIHDSLSTDHQVTILTLTILKMIMFCHHVFLFFPPVSDSFAANKYLL